MKEYRKGFTTKAALKDNGGKKSTFGEQIEVYTEKENIKMRIIGYEFETISMNKKEAEMLISLLKEAVKICRKSNN